MQMMKQGPMDWQFGDDPIVAEPPNTKNNRAPAPPPAPSSRWRTWLIVFLISLAASWTTGFYLGRVQRTTATLEAEIQGRLDVESWAWQQGDWGLFRSLLPPRTPSWHLRRLQSIFNAEAPEDQRMKLLHYVVSEDGNRVEVTAAVTARHREYEVERTYHLIGGRWRLVRLGGLDPSHSGGEYSILN